MLPVSVVTVQVSLAPSKVVGHMVDVAQDLGLRAVALRPMPFLLRLVGEEIRVFQAFRRRNGTRIAVPIPGAADLPALP